jgi:hypothetical protein
MAFHLECECGRTAEVSEGRAGTTYTCECGRKQVVPSIVRRRVHQTPEMVVEALLRLGRLPEGKECVLCGTETGGELTCMTECEKARTHSGKPSFVNLMFGAFLFLVSLPLAIVWAILGQTREGAEWESGKDVIFPLPLRICGYCQEKLDSPEEIKHALAQVPAYRDLLRKYPEASVSIVKRSRR